MGGRADTSIPITFKVLGGITMVIMQNTCILTQNENFTLTFVCMSVLLAYMLFYSLHVYAKVTFFMFGCKNRPLLIDL